MSVVGGYIDPPPLVKPVKEYHFFVLNLVDATPLSRIGKGSSKGQMWLFVRIGSEEGAK